MIDKISRRISKEIEKKRISHNNSLLTRLVVWSLPLSNKDIISICENLKVIKKEYMLDKENVNEAFVIRLLFVLSLNEESNQTSIDEYRGATEELAEIDENELIVFLQQPLKRMMNADNKSVKMNNIKKVITSKNGKIALTSLMLISPITSVATSSLVKAVNDNIKEYELITAMSTSSNKFSKEQEKQIAKSIEEIKDYYANDINDVNVDLLNICIDIIVQKLAKETESIIDKIHTLDDEQGFKLSDEFSETIQQNILMCSDYAIALGKRMNALEDILEIKRKVEKKHKSIKSDNTRESVKNSIVKEANRVQEIIEATEPIAETVIEKGIEVADTVNSCKSN